MQKSAIFPGMYGYLSLVILVMAVLVSPALAAPAKPVKPLTIDQTLEDEYREITGHINRLKRAQKSWRQRLQKEALDTQSLVNEKDVDPLDVVLRRTGALSGYLNTRKMFSPGFSKYATEFVALSTQAKSLAIEKPAAKPTKRPKPPKTAAERAARKAELAAARTKAAAFKAKIEARKELFKKVCGLRRKIAFSNPLANFDKIVCMLERPGRSRIVEQARASYRGHSVGGGPIIVSGFKSEPIVTEVLKGVKVAAGPWKGKELVGKFSGLELNYDGKDLLFAATTIGDVWRVFRFNLASKKLEQLTDGPHDDFDPHQLPSGRIVFTSTRRGGVGRCVIVPQALTYTLHCIEPDGSDLICLSFHETNEWAPTISHYGKLVYTRWDYVDRHWGVAHHYWESYPDGRDPRNFHGNYPLPHQANSGDTDPKEYGKRVFVYGRRLRPDAELSFRPIPDSQKYTATAVGHHQGFSGSLILLDPRIADDGKMAQLKRITAEYGFPEVERDASHTFGTAWPLSEDFYLCNYNYGLYLLDRFGNRDLIYDPGKGNYRVRAPVPLRSRRMPPALPVMTFQGKRAGLPQHKRAVISVRNVYTADKVATLPKGIKVKHMRIVQVIPQMLNNRFSGQTVRQIAFTSDSIGRIPLGIVPVESDGSVYCEAPVGKAIYFQLLDENGMAVHSMRSATYVHPGEHLSCLGCHEDKWTDAPRPSARPLAMKRAPSKIVQEVSSGTIPYNFIQLVKIPVFDKKCVPCHKKHPKKAPDMSYRSLAKHQYVFSCPGENPALEIRGVGGSRTTPGRFGAHVSGLVKALKTAKQHKDVKLTKDEWKRIILWLDLNSNEIGWIGNDKSKIQAQKEGKALWPSIDVDPTNVTGVEHNRPLR